jgi:hypothetical protein
MAAAAAAHGGGLDQFSHSFPNLGNCHLFKPRMFSHPNYAAPTWMRQREELGRIL